MQNARNCSLSDYAGPGNPQFIREYTEDLSVDVCPIGLITDVDTALLSLFFHTHTPIITSGGVNYVPHGLPRSGGILDQPGRYVTGCQIIRSELAGINADRMERMRKK